MKKIIVVGSGFPLSVALILLKKDTIEIFEKNEMPGGRARQFKRDGLPLILDPLGIGCQTFLKVTLETLGKK